MASDYRDRALRALSRCRVLSTLEPAARAQLLDAGQLVDSPGRTLLLEQDSAATHLFILCEGIVRAFINSAEGHEVDVRIFVGPAVFGEIECLASMERRENAVTRGRTLVLKVPWPAVDLTLQQYPTFCRALLDDVARRFCFTGDRERSLAMDDTRARLADVLCSYCEVMGIHSPEGIVIDVRLSQESLATTIGGSRRSVTRALATWRRAGVLSKRDGRFVIHELGVLRQAGAGVRGTVYGTGAPLPKTGPTPDDG
jgi:CRP-like cAMP-binding protein